MIEIKSFQHFLEFTHFSVLQYHCYPLKESEKRVKNVFEKLFFAIVSDVNETLISKLVS